MQVSVIVCTYNRVNSLRRCIESFQKVKTEAEWELIIVNNGSDDGTALFLQNLSENIAGGFLKIVDQSRRGLGIARNTGIRFSRGEIIAFTDDDCYVSRDYIDSILAAFEKDRSIGFIGGRILLYEPTDMPQTIQDRDEYLRLLPHSYFIPTLIMGANMAFKRETIQRIGGFDIALGAGNGIAADDTEAIASALWSGIAGAYDPSVVVYHHHGRKTKKDMRPIWKTYHRGRGMYFTKFILRPDSREAYLKIWTESKLNEIRQITSPRRLYLFLRGLYREFYGAIYYLRYCR